MGKEINEIYLGRMNNGAHYVFVDDVARKAEVNTTLVEKCSTQVTALRNAVNKEDECLALTSKSFYTNKIVEGDQKRGMYYGGYRKAVKGFLIAPLPELSEAAVILDQHMTDYGIEPQMQMDRETGLLINFIEDLEGKFAEYVATLGLTSFVTAIKDANEMVRTNKVERREERAGTVNGALKDARKASDDAYRMLVKYVNAINLLEGNADTQGFVDYVNTLIEEFKREVLGANAETPDASDNEENTTPDTNPDEGEDNPTPTPTPDPTPDPTPNPDEGGDDGDDEEVVG